MEADVRDLKIEQIFLKGSDMSAVNIPDLQVKNLVLFRNHEGGFVISPEQGTTLLLDNKTTDDISKGRISEALSFVMIQRGMASYQYSRDLVDNVSSQDPAFFLVDLTKSCNLNCAYCFRELDRVLPSMERDQMEKVTRSLIRHMREHNGMPISIQAWGGEPLLKLDLILLMRRMFEAEKLYPEIVIETNGTLISEKTAKLLVENNIHVGISIDGIAAVHDRQRPALDGQRSLDRTEKGIRNLRNAGSQHFGTITVVTKNTLVYLEDIVDYFAKELKLSSIKLNLMRKNERNQGLAVDPEDIPNYIERLMQCLYNLYRNGFTIREQNVFQRLLNLTCRPNNNICNSCGCRGGRRMLSIDQNGFVYPCELTDYTAFRMGTIDESFDEISYKASVAGNGFFADRILEKCHDCPWFYYCRGGCRSAAFYNSGSVTNIDETECAFNRALYPKLVEILINDLEFAEYLLRG